MRKVIFIFRVILYTAAAYILVDLFFLSPNENDRLRVFTKEKSKTYYEFYFSFNKEDSSWRALRTSPFLSEEINLGKESIWEMNPESMLPFKGYMISGFYLNPDLILDRRSYFTIQKNIDSIHEHDDPRLKKLNSYTPITIIFEIK